MGVGQDTLARGPVITPRLGREEIIMGYIGLYRGYLGIMELFSPPDHHRNASEGAQAKIETSGPVSRIYLRL